MRFSLLVLVLGFASCMATLPQRPQVFFMQPLTLQLGAGEVLGEDPVALFAKGNELFDQGLWRDALLHYQAVIEQEPIDAVYYPAVFNAGLSLTRLGDYGQAVTAFSAVAQGRDASLTQRSLWNLLDLLEREKRWGAALDNSNILYPLLTDNNERTEVDGHRRLLLAWRSSHGDPDQVLQAGDRWLREAKRKGPVPRQPRFLRAFLAGNGYAMRMSPETLVQRLHFGDNVTDTLTLALPVLEGEAQLLLDAQRWFLQAVRLSDNEWAGAAVFEIGELYRRFYHALLRLPIPAGLSPYERGVYIQELASKIEPVREKASLAYGRIIRFGRQQGIATPWMGRAEQSLKQMKVFDPLAAWGLDSPEIAD